MNYDIQCVQKFMQIWLLEKHCHESHEQLLKTHEIHVIFYIYTWLYIQNFHAKLMKKKISILKTLGYDRFRTLHKMEDSHN